MKKILLLFLCAALSFLIITAEEAPEEVVDFVYDELLSLSTDPIIIEAVLEANDEGKTLSEIRAIDEEWKATPGIDDFMAELLSSECAEYLMEIQDDYGFISEIFVMDDQGANVAMTDKTSDYWQGDEAKFINSYNDGDGDIFIDEVEFDDSSQTYSVQVSIPVDDDGDIIGAITIGIDLDAFED